MSQFTRYSFIPWLRQGIANSINEADGSASARVRASFDVQLKVNDSVSTEAIQVNLIGPGDIVGINPRAMVREEPRNWITDFEPNYLPFVEFYEEDFPWRYTPAKGNSSNHRLRPWLTLVVLTEKEFEDDPALAGPLKSITLKNKTGADLFPNADQLWAWAHVHVNDDLSTDEVNKVNEGVETLSYILDQNPDKAYSRLLCPRKLEPSTAYHAFLIPSFETGRLAGLGQDIPSDMVATKSAWDGPQKQFPVYHRWYFRTAESGDFEYLVRQLKPRPADKRVGIRPMDVTQPGASLPGILNPKTLGLGGALRAPQTEPTEWPASYPDSFQQALAERINLHDDYQQNEPDSDPVITPPLYARWHALVQRLNTPDNENLNWVHELNLDPRQRAASGLGTRVVQKNQEEYMNGAWQQIDQVLEANKKIKWIQLAWAATSRLLAKFVQPLKAPQLLAFTATIQARVLVSGQTAFARVKNSRLPAALLSPVFRKVVRVRGGVMQRFALAGLQFPANLIERVNAGEITPAPPKEMPEGATSSQELDDAVQPKGVPGWAQKLLTKWWIAYLPLFILIVLLIITLIFRSQIQGLTWLATLLVALLVIAATFIRWWKAINDYDVPGTSDRTPEAVGNLPPFSNFELAAPGESVSISTGSRDSGAAYAFKKAATDVHTLFGMLPEEEPQPPALNITEVAGTIQAALQPSNALLKRTVSYLKIPNDLIYWQPETIKPVMAYPKFDVPMYEPLRDISTELLVPNLNLIPQNSITLLETNQKFIESYMVGLNHEMARELLWREYVTDQRGTYFRQFWDTSNYVNRDESLTEEELKEKLRDIRPIHTWYPSTDLGTHNQREAEGDATQLVLVIRGDLLKKYPNTVIYAQRARWQTKTEGSQEVPDKTKPRLLLDVDETNPQDIRYPLYGAKVSPDIHFIGFNLTAEEAQGGDGNEDNTDPGWFFVIEERVGEPRFGLDVLQEGETPGELTEWNDMSWQHIQKNTSGNILLDTSLSLPAEADNPENVTWGSTSNAADTAYILFQLPVRVGVHASEMLKGID